MIDPNEKLPPPTLTEAQQHTHKILTEHHNNNPLFAKEIARLIAEKKRDPNEQTIYHQTVVRLADNAFDGARHVYYPAGMIWSIETWKDGFPWSIEADFFPDGRPVEGTFLHEGCGPQRYYYPDGAIKSWGELRNGKGHGLWVYLHPSGAKRGEGRREDGDKVGEWSWYNEKGELYATEECEPEGNYQQNFWPNMKLRSVGYYIKDQQGKSVRTGLWREYNTQGQESILEYDLQGKLLPKKG